MSRSLSQSHQGVAVPVDLQLAEETQCVDEFFYADAVPEVLPEDLEDKDLEHALLLPVLGDQGDDGKLFESQVFLDTGISLLRASSAASQLLLIFTNLILL